MLVNLLYIILYFIVIQISVVQGGTHYVNGNKPMHFSGF